MYDSWAQEQIVEAKSQYHIIKNAISRVHWGSFFSSTHSSMCFWDSSIVIVLTHLNCLVRAFQILHLFDVLLLTEDYDFNESLFSKNI